MITPIKANTPKEKIATTCWKPFSPNFSDEGVAIDVLAKTKFLSKQRKNICESDRFRNKIYYFKVKK